MLVVFPTLAGFIQRRRRNRDIWSRVGQVGGGGGGWKPFFGVFYSVPPFFVWVGMFYTCGT